MNNPYQQGGFLPPSQYGGHHQAQYMGGNQGQSSYGGHMNGGNIQQAYTSTGRNPAVEGDKGKKGLITPLLIKWLQAIIKTRMDDALVLQNYPIDQVYYPNLKPGLMI
jgi:hypothetical protein